MIKAFKFFSLRIREIDHQVRKSVEESPAFYITLALAMLIVMFFRNIVTFLLNGLFFVAVAFIVMTAAFLVWIKAKHGRPSLRELIGRRDRALDALDIARQHYMQRKITKQGFNKFFVEKQGELIKFEALIAQFDDKKHDAAVGKQLVKVDAKNRHILRNLLDYKRRLIKELEIVQASYLKRKITTEAYQEIVEKNQKKLIETEAELKSFYREDQASKVMKNLKKNLPKKKRKISRAAKKRKADLEFVSQISDQAVKK